MSKIYTFYIDKVTCCNKHLLESSLHLNGFPLIEAFHIDLTTPGPKKATVIITESIDHNEDIENLLRVRIEKAGFNCRPAAEPLDGNHSVGFIKQIPASHWFLGALGLGLGIALFITFLVATNLPLRVMIGLGTISTTLTLVLGASSYIKAWKNLIHSKTLTMDSLFTVGSLSVIIVSISSLFFPGLPMMFEASLLIYGFRHIGLAIEEALTEKIHTATFQDRIPKKTRLVLKSGLYDLPVNAIQPGDIIEIHPGELIPLDGFCLEDIVVDTTTVTGETIPSSHKKVLAGMRLVQPNLVHMHVINSAKNSFLARIDASIAQSLQEKAPLELKAEKWLTYFIPVVILLALLSGAMMSLFLPFATAIKCALSILVSVCPCTLGLVIPLAVKTGINKAAEYGAHFKNPKALQEMEKIDTLVFDLNGTLTTGVPRVKRFGLLHKSFTAAELFGISAVLEATSEHPIGQAISLFTQDSSTLDLKVDTLQTIRSGVKANINGRNYCIGDVSVMKEQGITITPMAQDKQLHLKAGDRAVYLSQENTLVGYFIVTDPLRKDAFKTIQRLKEMGKDIHLCTGSDEQTARRYADALGIKKVFANSLATSLTIGDNAKPSYIQSLQKANKKVAMVGDAANDASALATSNLGIAILSLHADKLTQQQAGLVTKNGALMPIVNAFAVSRQTVRNMNQNLFMSLGYNLVSVLLSGGLGAAAGFTINPAMGAALMVIQAGLILLNVYRFKQKPLAHLKSQFNDHHTTPMSQRIKAPILGDNGVKTLENLNRIEEPPYYSALFNFQNKMANQNPASQVEYTNSRFTG